MFTKKKTSSRKWAEGKAKKKEIVDDTTSCDTNFYSFIYFPPAQLAPPANSANMLKMFSVLFVPARALKLIAMRYRPGGRAASDEHCEEAVEEKLPNMAESRSSAERRAQVHRFHALIVSFVLCRTQQLYPTTRYRDECSSSRSEGTHNGELELSHGACARHIFAYCTFTEKKQQHKAHTKAAEIRILCHAKVHQRSLFSTSRLCCTVHCAHSALTFVRLRMLAGNFWRFFQLNFSWERLATCKSSNWFSSGTWYRLSVTISPLLNDCNRSVCRLSSCNLRATRNHARCFFLCAAQN